ncbi:MAG: site-specific integrase [Thaumarchaeota archaeon]|nr:site-specific integrase [Nitrososphaerota archaeon]
MSSFLIKQKTKKSFEDKIRKLAQKTKANIYASENSFKRFCLEFYDGRNSKEIFSELNILKGEEQVDALREVLQNWIDWQYSNGSLTSGVQQYLSKIKRVFSHNGVKIHLSDFDEPLEFKPKVKEELHELTVEEIQNIFKFANPKKMGFYLALSCSGARPSELLQVRKKDVDTSKKRIKIRIEAENVKTRSGRSIWLTKEAGSFLMTKLRGLNDSDLVWATNENFSYAEKNESTQFSKICDKAGYSQKYKSNNFRKITLYSFRSFFYGKASDVHREGYAHKMIGHGGYLPQYDRMSDEKKLNWFLELEPKLIIDSTVRLREENKLKEQKIKKLESEKDIQLKDMQSQIDTVMKLLDRKENLNSS